MLGIIKHYASVGICSFKLSLQRQFEYPIYILSCFIMIPMMYGSGVLLLYFMVKNFQPINGWTFPHLVFVYGIGNVSHAVMMVFAGQLWNMENYIIRGEFDRMLLRPLNPYYQFVSSEINFIALMDLITGGIIFSYGCSLVKFEWSAANTAKVVMVVLGAALIRFSIFTVICTISFWTKKSMPLLLLATELLDRTTLYPISIYPFLLQFIFTFIIPVAFISFYPACEFLAQDDRFNIPLGLSVWTPIVGILTIIPAILFFNYALRSYESAGS